MCLRVACKDWGWGVERWKGLPQESGLLWDQAALFVGPGNKIWHSTVERTTFPTSAHPLHGSGKEERRLCWRWPPFQRVPFTVAMVETSQGRRQ